MKTSIFFLLTIITAANAFSELIPSDNFSIKYESSFWVKCNVVDLYSFQEAVFENPQARERVQTTKQNLEIAYIAAKAQETLGSNPPLYSFLGFQCTASEVDALRESIIATTIIARQIDTELEKLEFEIGDNFTGPGSTELIDAKEAQNINGVIGETVVKIQRGVAEAAWEIQRKGPVKVAGQTAIWLVENNGAGQKLENYLDRIIQSQQDVKTLEQLTAGELQEKMQQAQDTIEELEQEDVNKLGKFELSQLNLPTENTLEIDATYASSPAGLLEESKRNLEKAKAIQRASQLFTTKGRTANKINTYRTALKSIALSKMASEKSLEKTLTILEEIENNAKEQAQLAKNITKPIGKSMAEKLIASVKLGETYYSKISNLASLAKNLNALVQIYSGKVDEADKLNLKIEIRKLQTIAKEAVSKEVAGASEVVDSLANNYALIGGISNPGELQQIQDETAENREVLAELIEDKFSDLKKTYQDATQLAQENSLTSQEERELGQISEAFVGTEEFAEKITDFNEFQSTLDKIIESAMKRKTAIPTGNTTKQNSTSLFQTSSQTQYAASITNTSTVDTEVLLKRLEEIANAGLTAFHSDGKTKKTLEQLKFETALKKAQANAKDLQKNPSNQKVEDLKKQIGEMENAIQDAQRKASVEIAIAEQRSDGANEEIQKAQQSWEAGKYTEALLKAQEVNKQSATAGSAKITGQVTSSNDEPKLWAIGASLVIILIGAAYLIYAKKSSETESL